MLQHLNLLYWREAAQAFKDKDRRKQVPLRDRIAIHRLISGDTDTLHIPEEEMTPAQKQLMKVKQFVKDVDKEAESGKRRNSQHNPKT